jgi:hypothetical protein
MKTRRYSLQPATMSTPGDDDLGHDRAMSDGVREVKPCGEGIAIGQRRLEKLRNAITFKPKLDFGQGFSRWKALGEHRRWCPNSRI